MFRGRRNETSGQFDAEYLGDVANNLNVANESFTLKCAGGHGSAQNM